MLYAPKSSTCSKHRKYKETGNEDLVFTNEDLVFTIAQIKNSLESNIAVNLFAVGVVMDTNQRQIALSLFESLRADLLYAHLKNGSRVLDVADLRQYLYEQMTTIRTNALMDGLYGTDGRGQDPKSNGNGKAHS